MTDNFPKYKRAKTPQFWRAQTASSVIKLTHTHTPYSNCWKQEAIAKKYFFVQLSKKKKKKNITPSEVMQARRQWISSKHGEKEKPTLNFTSTENILQQWRINKDFQKRYNCWLTDLH